VKHSREADWLETKLPESYRVNSNALLKLCYEIFSVWQMLLNAEIHTVTSNISHVSLSYYKCMVSNERTRVSDH